MASNTFTLKSKRDNDVLIVTCGGHFDYDAYEKNKKRLESMAGSDDSNIVVDMSGVSYLSSRGIGFLVSLYDHAESNNGAVRIVGLKGSIKKVFEKTGYFNIFNYFDSLEEAMKF